MYSGQDIFAEREKIKKSINEAQEDAKRLGIELADKTMEYRMLSAQKILQLKAEGMQISIIDKVSKGDREVAQTERDMICKEVLYKAANESINCGKKFLDSIEADIKREIYVGSKE